MVPPPFETGIPIILLFLFKPAPGQTYTGTIFAVQIDQATIPGQSLETIVTIADPSGRVDPSNAIPVRLTAVPEASGFTLTAAGFLLVLAASRRRPGASRSAEKPRKGLVSRISRFVELLRSHTHAVDPERPVSKCS